MLYNVVLFDQPLEWL